MMLIVPLPWCKRPWALPFLPVLAPSKKSNEAAGHRHKTSLDWTRQMTCAVSRWIRRYWILVGDGAFACMDLALTCIRLKELLNDPKQLWQIDKVDWYGGKPHQIEYLTFTCLWYHAGFTPVTLRIVLVKTPQFELYDIVAESTDKPYLREIADKKGIVRGISFCEDDSSVVSYAVDMPSSKTNWFIFEEDLMATGKKPILIKLRLILI